ncbi:DUF3325 family protein [Psychrobacter sp. I-STPA10]|uniref:DUF3325 family protein n=1 Tax=Psychrobacter sp. I-STPA10 TaxID=2585769 RepID=UPI001E62CFE4|nr:DUF3325 family protein [Psychrobacter sp. I-STPA10]
MSDSMLYVLLLLFNGLGMVLLMMSSKRHGKKFLPHLQAITPIDIQAQWLRWLGLILCSLAFFLPFFARHTGYFVVVWFGSLSLAAGLIYLYLVVYEVRVMK